MVTTTAPGLLACLLVLGLGLPAPAQTVQRSGDGRVSVNATEMPFGQLLRELAELAGASLRIDPAVEDQPVSLLIEGMTVTEALHALLRASTVNFVAVGLETTGPIRLMVGAPRAAVSADIRVASSTDEKLKSLPLLLTAPAMTSPEEDAQHKEQERIAGEEADRSGSGNVPGQVSPAEWLQAMTTAGGVRTERRGVVTLPFVDESGGPMQQDVGAAPPAAAMLPFVDDSGQPIVLPALLEPGAPVLLPFADRGQPVYVPAAPVMAARPGAPR